MPLRMLRNAMMLRKLGQTEETPNVVAALGPLVAGTIMGFVVWQSARSLNIDPQKSRGLAITIGVTTAIGQLATKWMSALAEKAGVSSNVLG